MSLDKTQLEALNNSLFADNTSGDISPFDLRGFNSSSIDAYALENQLRTNFFGAASTGLPYVVGGYGSGSFWNNAVPLSSTFNFSTQVDCNNNRLFLTQLYTTSGSVITDVMHPLQVQSTGTASVKWAIYNVDTITSLPLTLYASGSITTLVTGTTDKFAIQSGLSIPMDSNRYWAGFMVENNTIVKLSSAESSKTVSNTVFFTDYPTVDAIRPLNEIHYDAGQFNCPLTLSGSNYGMRDDMTFFFYK